MLVFEYRKAPFSIEAEKALDAGIKKIAAENTVINIYINVFIYLTLIPRLRIGSVSYTHLTLPTKRIV